MENIYLPMYRKPPTHAHITYTYIEKPSKYYQRAQKETQYGRGYPRFWTARPSIIMITIPQMQICKLKIILVGYQYIYF